MKVTEIQARCQAVRMTRGERARAESEREFYEGFIRYVARLRIPVVSVKAQMVLSTQVVIEEVEEE